MHNNHSIDLMVLKNNYRSDLDELFKKIKGNKTVIWDDSIAGCFDLITEFNTTLFKQKNGVEKMFLLQKLEKCSFETENAIFIVKPQIPIVEHVAQLVASSRDKISAGPFEAKFHLIFVPRHSLICELKLKELQVHSFFSSIEVFYLNLIPFETDFLSMELDTTYRQCFLEGDQTPVYNIAKALMSLQALYGVIPHLHAKGDCAAEVLNLMLQMIPELAVDKQQIVSQIDHLLILDRTVDPITPLLTQLTYEGLIDEYFGISNCVARFPSEKFASSNDTSNNSKAGGIKKFVLNSSDELFCELRDQNINAVGPTISRRVKSISALYDKRNDAKTVSEMKQFVADLPVMQAKKASLANHTTITELIRQITNTHEFRQFVLEQKEYLDANDLDKSQAYIEDAIALQEPLTKVLRLICLQCYCNGGFKPKLLEFYKREIVQTYGYQHLLNLHNLEKAGLIRIQTGPKNYPTISKSLNLLAEKVDEQNPTDISYVFSGYSPLSVKLAQILHQPGWRKITEILQILPGKLREETQKINYKNYQAEYEDESVKSNTTLVFIIGGITFAEISALRFLSQMETEKRPSKFLIASTNIINGKTFIESLMEIEKSRPSNPF